MPLSGLEDLSLAYGLNHYELDAPYRLLLRHFLGVEPDLRRLGEYTGSIVYEAMYRVDRLSQPLLHTWSVRGERVDRVWLDPAERMVLEELVDTFKVNSYPFNGDSWHLHYAGIYLVGDPGLSCILTITIQTAYALYKYGDSRIRGYYRRLAGLEKPLMWGATWFTEVQGGSDLGANTTRATPEGGLWRLNGYKYFASGAGIADLALVTARPPRSGPGAKGLALFLVPRIDSRGNLNYAVRRLKWKSGTVAVPTGEVELIDSEAYLVGEEDKGIYYTLEDLMVSRLANAIGAVGIARKAYIEAYRYVMERRAFGKRVYEHPLAYRDLLEMEAEIEASLALTMKAISVFDGAWGDRPPYTSRYHYARLLTHIAKNVTAEASARVTQTAMELWGGIGFLHEFPVERWHREALITPIWEGTSNIQALDMLEAMYKKQAHIPLMEDLEETSSDVADEKLAKTVIEDARRTLDALSKASPGEAEYMAKDVLRRLGTATAVITLLNASARTGDDAMAEAARIYYELKTRGSIRMVPREVGDQITSLRGNLK
ncbi:MAG: acyl-CoA dehydrogenase family protein [Desulfurococcales archaeon]|nr:acyl-CoA dehydrogenase family protein [Desulfurococcales archaeon]